jgi:hypothetical protein
MDKETAREIGKETRKLYSCLNNCIAEKVFSDVDIKVEIFLLDFWVDRLDFTPNIKNKKWKELTLKS